jgi:uncharacterized delta-60 repeat protein
LAPDGGIIVLGRTFDGPVRTDVVVRYRRDGSIDAGFADAGVLRLPTDLFRADPLVAVQPDGRIVVADTEFPAAHVPPFLELLRYNVDGTPDTGFGTGGQVNVPVDQFGGLGGLLVRGDGRIVVVGVVTAGFPGSTGGTVIWRVNPDGTPDRTLDEDGVATPPAVFRGIADVEQQADGKLVVIGASDLDQDFALARFHDDGTLDTGFGVGGMVITDVDAGSHDLATGLVIHDDETLTVGGTSLPSGGIEFSFALAHYTVDGTLDPRFGGDGIVAGEVPGEAADLELQRRGKLVLAGNTASIRLARYHA